MFSINSAKYVQYYMTVITSPTNLLPLTNISGVIDCLLRSKFLFYLALSFFYTNTKFTFPPQDQELLCVCPPVNQCPGLKLSARFNRLYLLAVSTASRPRQESCRITTSMTECLLLYTRTVARSHMKVYGCR